MTIEEDDNKEIQALWPGGLPDSEQALWLRLPAGRRRRALSRLKAVLGLYPPPGRPVIHSSMAAAAGAAGTGVSTFYAIARRWREAPSLAALGVHATSDGPGKRMDEAEEGFDARIREWLREDPDLTVSDIRTRLGADVPGHPAFATVRRTAQRVLRGLPPRRPFGSEVVFDSAGIDLSLEAGSDPAVLRLNAVVDVATGLVLGWDVGPEADMLASYARAVRRAWPRIGREKIVAERRGGGLSRLDLTGAAASGEVPTLHVNLVPGIGADFPAGGDVAVHANPRTGASLVAALGERLGPVWIGSGVREPGRSFRTGRIDPMPSFGTGIEDLVDEAISRHNLARLQLIPRDASPDEARRMAAEIGRRARALFGAR